MPSYYVKHTENNSNQLNTTSTFNIPHLYLLNKPFKRSQLSGKSTLSKASKILRIKEFNSSVWQKKLIQWTLKKLELVEEDWVLYQINVGIKLIKSGKLSHFYTLTLSCLTGPKSQGKNFFKTLCWTQVTLQSLTLLSMILTKMVSNVTPIRT